MKKAAILDRNAQTNSSSGNFYFYFRSRKIVYCIVSKGAKYLLERNFGTLGLVFFYNGQLLMHRCISSYVINLCWYNYQIRLFNVS